MNQALISDQGKLVRAELDMQITTAKAYPRNPDNFIQFATQLATQNEETAQSCFYCLTRKSKDGKVTEIKGASIRQASRYAHEKFRPSCPRNLFASRDLY